mgnify:CR=1 FL=1
MLFAENVRPVVAQKAHYIRPCCCVSGRHEDIVVAVRRLMDLLREGPAKRSSLRETVALACSVISNPAQIDVIMYTHHTEERSSGRSQSPQFADA